MEDVLEMYRLVQKAKEMLEWVLDEVLEQSWINTMFREVTDTGPSAVSKLELKVCNRQVVVHIVEDLMEEAMDMVHKRERKSLQERKRMEWKRKWEALDIELAREMDILTELVPEPMEVTETIAHSNYMEVDLE